MQIMQMVEFIHDMELMNMPTKRKEGKIRQAN